jgi:hypothetical protein
MPGTVAIWRMASVFFFGVGQLIQLVVEMATWGWKASTAPEPTQAEWRSGVPATTRTPSGRPRSAATEGSTVPRTEAVADSGGSLSAGTPLARTRTGSYSRTSGRRLSVSQAPAIDAGPVKRIER